jgi:hypothetical protein
MLNFQFFIRNILTKKPYPYLQNNALRMISIFGSSYTCEYIFSRMKFINSKTRARLTDIHLGNSLRIASS